MKDERKTKSELLAEMRELRQRVAKLEQAEKALWESRGKYRTLVERASDGIIVLQQEKVVYHKPVCEKLLGYTVSEVRGRSFLEVIAPEDRDRVRGYYYPRLGG